MNLTEYALDLQQSIISECELEGQQAFREEAFTRLVTAFLSETGELDDADVCLHRAYGLQVNGFSISENGERIDLIVAAYTDEVPPSSVAKDDVLTSFKRVTKFAEKAFNGYHKEVDESTPVFDLAQRLFLLSTSVAAVRFILISDGFIKADPPRDYEKDGIQFTYHIWDIERLFRCWSSGREREAIEVDFLTEHGETIPCLSMPVADGVYNTYLAIFPGRILSDIYGKHGPRLLERNVRSFLQARGKINAGIRRTITKEAHMFLAYNNGLSCTAEAVEIVDEGQTKRIKGLRDLQIVNGGQTIASIYYAQKRDKADLSDIYVQVKLTVLQDAAEMDVVVPRISEYANSQNKVQIADFAANDKYHRRLEELSRTIWAPPTDGSQRHTHWYYERARGQYQDDLAREGTPARQKDFKTKNPPTQLFGKTDLAKFAYTWAEKPHIVSRGAQSCFSDFTVSLDKHVEAEGPIDQTYFEHIVAKAILFRTAERIMRELAYPGYRANLVTYSLARIAHQWRKLVDLKEIWREQAVPQEVIDSIKEVSRACYDHITTNANGGNVTQYCKKEDCWRSFIDREIPMPSGLQHRLHKKREAGNGRGPAPSPVDENISRVLNVGADVWFRLGEWGEKSNALSALDRKIASDIALVIGYGKTLNTRQANDAIRIMEAAQRNGFKV